MRSTYSPEDNKLRLYPSRRLDPDDYQRVKEAGYRWAPKQEVFVAPRWTPEAEDLALELAGEIEDEDQGLVERAEERAERFTDYAEARREEAGAARAAVDEIAQGIPLGQPILVGHHSERHARRDAERIQSGMRRAVNLWETSEYWKRRATAALRHARYKERPDVRSRRLKILEGDRRKYQRSIAEWESELTLWEGRATFVKAVTGETLTLAITEENRELLGNVLGCRGGTYYLLPRKEGDAPDFDGRPSPYCAITNAHPTLYAPRTVAEVQAACLETIRASLARCHRWVAHLDRRIEYEQAMLAETGGTVADRSKPEKGGAVRCWASPGRQAGWSWVVKVNRVSVTVLDNWGNGGANFTRTIPFDKLWGVMSRAEVESARAEGRINETPDKRGFFLADRAEPAPTAKPGEPDATPAEADPVPAAPVSAEDRDFQAMKDTLRTGVQVVVAPQLFPTPLPLARRMVELADILPGHRVCEPSAGTGHLVQAIRQAGFNGDIHLDVIEVHPDLCRRLRDLGEDAGCHNWLDVRMPYCPDVTDGWDRILMNPPFERGSDIAHIRHAYSLLREGGRLVAICVNNAARWEAFADWPRAHWEPLPRGTFAEQGTLVDTALVAFDKPGIVA